MWVMIIKRPEGCFSEWSEELGWRQRPLKNNIAAKVSCYKKLNYSFLIVTLIHKLDVLDRAINSKGDNLSLLPIQSIVTPNVWHAKGLGTGAPQICVVYVYSDWCVCYQLHVFHKVTIVSQNTTPFPLTGNSCDHTLVWMNAKNL